MMWILALFLGVAVSSAMEVNTFSTPATICGYLPLTRIRDYAVIDLDHEAIRHRLTLGEISKARNLYELGGNSYPVAKLTLQTPPDAQSFPAGTKVYGTSKSRENSVFGTLMEDVSWEANTQGNVTLKVAYFSSLYGDMPEESQCRVGGYYTFERANLNGCFTDESGTVELVLKDKAQGSGVVLPYVYDVRHDNYNEYTLQTLSTRETAGNKACPDCPYFDDFAAYLEYYGDADFGNKWIMAASLYDTTQFSAQRGQADFGSTPKIGIAEAMIVGILEMNVLLEIIQSVEQATATCQEGCSSLLCNEEAIYFLDKAVALYCGSIEGEKGTGDGVFQYALAQRRSAEFGVNTPGKTTNDRLINQFQSLQDVLLQGKCATTEAHKQMILSLLKVPLVQSILRYAYVRDHVLILDIDEKPKAEAFGASYAAVVVPLVHKCHRADANLIYDHLRIGSEASAVSFERVKQALEDNYECMGISCEDVGGIWTEEGFAEGAEPCVSGSAGRKKSNAKNNSSSGVAVLSFMGASLTAVLLTVAAYFYWRRPRGSHRRRRHVRSSGTSGNIAAVSNIT